MCLLRNKEHVANVEVFTYIRTDLPYVHFCSKIIQVIFNFYFYNNFTMVKPITARFSILVFRAYSHAEKPPEYSYPPTAFCSVRLDFSATCAVAARKWI